MWIKVSFFFVGASKLSDCVNCKAGTYSTAEGKIDISCRIKNEIRSSHLIIYMLQVLIVLILVYHAVTGKSQLQKVCIFFWWQQFMLHHILHESNSYSLYKQVQKFVQLVVLENTQMMIIVNVFHVRKEHIVWMAYLHIARRAKL